MGDSTDYNSNGFNQGGDGAVFGDPGSDPGSVSDYDTWDWKQIMAAINGMSAGVDSSGNQSHALSVSDPTSLQSAADAFYSVQQTLAQIAKSLSDQANALAGPNGPWTGDAADSFIDMMNTFSKQVDATANVLSGGATGTDSVPQQLADNSVNLLTAQNKIVEIDNWYANQAIEMGVQPMSNGLIPISQKPQLVDMMTTDMRAVLKSLAGEYQVTIDAVRSPQPITSPGDNNPDTNDPNDPADISDQDPGADLPLSAVTSGLPTDTEDSPAAFPSDLSTTGDGGLPDSAGLDPGALDAALNPGSLDDPSAFPGGTGVGGADDLASLPGGTGLDPLGSTDPLDSISPSAFPGGTGVGTGTGGLPLEAEDEAADPLADEAGESFPGGLGTGGLGGLTGDEGADKAAAFPGGLSTESGLPDSLDSGADGLGALGTGSDAAGDGMPYMPGAGGAGGQTGDPNGERSDASGLLDGDATPWDGSTDVGEDAGSPLGTAAGGSALDGLGDLDKDGLGTGLSGADGLGALGSGSGAGGGDAGDGMPYMPGAGGAPGQAGDPNGERSDASGLIDGDADPWEGEPDVGEDVGSRLGAAAGGSGLDGLDSGLSGTDGGTGLGSTDGDEAGEGMPYMPGAGGAPGQTGDPNGERSDASGLLEGDADPWQGEPDSAEEVGSALGTVAGAAALELLVAGAVTAAAGAVEHEQLPPAQVPVAAEATAWTGPPEGVEAAAEAEQPTAAPESVVEPIEEAAVPSPDEPVAPTGQAEGESLEESAAWDAAGESLVPLLWGLVNSEEERDVLSSGYATAEEGAWTGQPTGPVTVANADGDPDDPGWATWRPNRAPSPGGLTERALAATSALSASCSTDAFDEVAESEEPDEPEQAAPSRSIADLLVQDGDTWGSPGWEDSDAIL